MSQSSNKSKSAAKTSSSLHCEEASCCGKRFCEFTWDSDNCTGALLTLTLLVVVHLDHLNNKQSTDEPLCSNHIWSHFVVYPKLNLLPCDKVQVFISFAHTIVDSLKTYDLSLFTKFIVSKAWVCHVLSDRSDPGVQRNRLDSHYWWSIFLYTCQSGL